MIIVPFETEAKNLFGVLYMEQIQKTLDEQRPSRGVTLTFEVVRNGLWESLPQQARQQMLGLADWCDKLQSS